MRIAVTGATGFIGRYIAGRLLESGHSCRCWHRKGSDRESLAAEDAPLEWVEGELNGGREDELVAGCDAVIHAALYHPGGGFRGGEGELTDFVERNMLGTLRLIEAARRAGVGRFVFISTCAVHEQILEDRPLDEAHPLWPMSHYGAHKAALEKFVHSFGLGQSFPICALRPTGVYGAARPIHASKWYDLVAAVTRGEDVNCRRGGKEVHAADVAKGAELLLSAESIAGEAFNCYDRYISEFDVATIAKEISGSGSRIAGGQTRPKHQIETGKLKALGMEFSGEKLLRETISQLVDAVRR